MGTGQLLDLALALIIGTVTLAGQSWVKRYFSEKASILATKQDLEKTTRTIESVKLEAASDLEKFRAELSHASHVGKVQFDKEFAIYTDLWSPLSI